MKRIFKAFVVVIVLMFGIYVLILTTIDWHEVSRKVSPDGNIAAFHMRSGSEAGQAPYGDHIVLVPRYKLFGQYYTSAVFAGYCLGREFVYEWIGQNVLKITCTYEKVVRREASYGDIVIKYEFLDKDINNKPLTRESNKSK